MPRRCHAGREQPACCDQCVIAEFLPRGKDGDQRNRLCPVHDDEHASLSANPGTRGMWLVWHCKTGCHEEDVRDALLARGAHPSCLGNYGKPRTQSRNDSAPGRGTDPAVLADAARWHAVTKLAGFPELNGQLVRICIQAISEGDGDLPGDPYMLLPADRDDFVALASRAGVDPQYRYRLYRKWFA